jgi:bifunctional DNase/RNase
MDKPPVATAVSKLETTDAVEMQIRGLMMDPATNMPIVVLKDVESDTILPIWVGAYEANAIAYELEKATVARPLTHDLLRDVTRALGATVERVVVSALRGDTYYATICMRQGTEPVIVDARPSDAIALALRWDCPIFVERSVLERARPAQNALGVTPEQTRRWLEDLNDDEMGHYKM